MLNRCYLIRERESESAWNRNISSSLQCGLGSGKGTSMNALWSSRLFKRCARTAVCPSGAGSTQGNYFVVFAISGRMMCHFNLKHSVLLTHLTIENSLDTDSVCNVVASSLGRFCGTPLEVAQIHQTHTDDDDSGGCGASLHFHLISSRQPARPKTSVLMRRYF